MIKRPTRTMASGRRGQAVVFLVLVLTILAFVFLWNVDLHRIIAAKSLSQNAGDAAALAAARWQGDTLNLVGELNVMHALALAANDGATAATIEAITNIQARLCFTGPMVALMAAQVAAKNNRIYEETGFSDLLRVYAAAARRYDEPVDGAPAYPPPFPGAWDAYADMLETAAAHGIAAAPDNARFYNDRVGDHILLDRAFYEAVAGRNWCWFYLHHRYSDDPLETLLDVYTDHTWWDPLPEPDPPGFANSEIFGLGLRAVTVELGQVLTEGEFRTGAAQQALIDPALALSNVLHTTETWYGYDPGVWTAWDAVRTDGPEPFPIVGPVKPEYDYQGADVAVRVYANADRLTQTADGETAQDAILWTAAAKPFGYLESDDAAHERLRPDAFGLVFPAFRDVRLIAVDAASGSGSGSFDLDWRIHIEEHLPDYVDSGAVQSGCSYCDLLTQWEVDSFRLTGIRWLLRNSHRCQLPSDGPGDGSGGGTRRGH